MELTLKKSRTATGHLPNKYGIGWALSSVSFYLLAEAIIRVLNGFGYNIVRDGYGTIYQFMILLEIWSKIAASYASIVMAFYVLVNFALEYPCELLDVLQW